MNSLPFLFAQITSFRNVMFNFVQIFSMLYQRRLFLACVCVYVRVRLFFSRYSNKSSFINPLIIVHVEFSDLLFRWSLNCWIERINIEEKRKEKTMNGCEQMEKRTVELIWLLISLFVQKRKRTNERANERANERKNFNSHRNVYWKEKTNRPLIRAFQISAEHRTSGHHGRGAELLLFLLPFSWIRQTRLQLFIDFFRNTKANVMEFIRITSNHCRRVTPKIPWRIVDLPPLSQVNRDVRRWRQNDNAMIFSSNEHAAPESVLSGTIGHEKSLSDHFDIE